MDIIDFVKAEEIDDRFQRLRRSLEQGDGSTRSCAAKPRAVKKAASKKRTRRAA